MIIGWLLAAEAGGFGVDFNILETNLINLVIIIGVLYYFGGKFLGKTLSTRRAAIKTEIVEAEQRKQEAAAALAEQQQKLAQAQQEAKKILAEAKVTADRTRDEILEQSQIDVERMRANAAQDLTSQEARVMRELQQRIATLAIERSEAALPGQLNDDLQRRLVDSSIAMLKGE
ncbi:F0F1 ATP synthase subunit B [Nodosilinea sp. LEGE 07298]|uniref:F0F1 ATP synthase subunit B n=1 Tax=Nodosilinea sp. LEGE 07298 TaxID=2777970 RepID=UPI00187E43E0|nr:F0F1 ATP synthase subunit B [Nodosilinea sp. LEGE 07298]MBE9108314.1 F0F1 ATP synthase subunit B [Nodosilinea sp. LEGE 07298]